MFPLSPPTPAPPPIEGLDTLASPALLFDADQIHRNYQAAIAIAGSADRLRPHVKTHKTAEVVAIAQRLGITKHKCATLNEAEMLARAGAGSVLVAYPLIGPALRRLVRLTRDYPETRWGLIVDNALALEQLAGVATDFAQPVEVLIDLDVGQGRTGVADDQQALQLAEAVVNTRGVVLGGLHAYDGHNSDSDRAKRAAIVAVTVERLQGLLDQMQRRGLPCSRLVCGGTPSFPIWAEQTLPGLECSPGTFVLHDYNYASRFADLAGFAPAAYLLTRVVSRPRAPAGDWPRLTVDLGYKAISADQPLERRCYFPALPEARLIGHSEEHLILASPQADQVRLGQPLLAIPGHVCPTCALFDYADVVRAGRVTERWAITARAR